MALALAALTFVVFSPAVHNGFLYEWDDTENLVENPHFRGFTWANLSWMLTAGRMGHYIPVTWLSFVLDHSLWGMNPQGYHLTNALLHAANTALVYLLARRLLHAATRRVGVPLAVGAAVAALFFGVHPLRAESVAWATERRDVLSAFFALLAVIGYLRALDVEGRARRLRLTLSVAAYVLALGAKSIVMTLPAVLVILDVYPLRRLGTSPRTWRDPDARRVWREKLPYAAAALVAAVVAYLVVHANTRVTPLAEFPVVARVFVALYGLAFYVSRTAMPLGLTPLYELPAHVDPWAPPFLLSGLAVIAGAIVVVVGRRMAPAAPWLGAYYVIALAPVLGVVHSGHQLVHDRYSYLACLGWAVLIGAAVSALVAGGAGTALRPMFRYGVLVAVAAWLFAMVPLTSAQVQVWRDDETLWRTAVDVDPDCSLCHGNLGSALQRRSQLDPALWHLSRAVDLRPERVRPRYNLAVTLIAMGRADEAVSHLQRVLEHEPRNTKALEALGLAWIAQRRYADALLALREAVALGAAGPEIDTHLALTLHELGRPSEAVPLFLRAIATRPEATPPRVGLVRAYAALGDGSAMREQYEHLAALDARLAAHVTAGLPASFAKEAFGGHTAQP